MMPKTTVKRDLLAAVAPDSWPIPAEPPQSIRDAPDPLAALKASVRLTIRRDLARVHLDSETSDLVIAAALLALAKALTDEVSLADAVAAALLAERVVLAVVLALEPPVEEWPAVRGTD